MSLDLLGACAIVLGVLIGIVVMLTIVWYVTRKP